MGGVRLKKAKIEHTFFQIRPNLRLRNEDQRIELRTVNALRNVERDQWKTTYDYSYTGEQEVMYILPILLNGNLQCAVSPESFFISLSVKQVRI